MTCEMFYRANPDVVLREESDDWALLFNPSDGQIIGVNPVGTAVWKLLDGNLAPSEIAVRIQTDFSGVPDTVTDEVNTFIQQLVERGFIGKVLS